MDLGLDRKLNENKAPAALPGIKFNNVRNQKGLRSRFKSLEKESRTFFKAYESYKLENMPFRYHMFELYKLLKHSLGVQVLPSRVIQCGDWYFMGDQFNKVVSHSKALINLPPKALRKVEDNIRTRQGICEETGSQYYLVVAPNKHSVYGDKIGIIQGKRPTLFDQLKSLEDIPLIDLGLSYHLFPDVQLYHKIDSHWNSTGAFMGYHILTNTIRKDFSRVIALSIGEVTTEKIMSERQDLIRMLNDRVDDEQEIVVPKSVRSINCSAGFRLDCLKDLDQRPFHYKVRMCHPERPYKVLVFRDSYCRAMMPFLNESFGEILYIYDRFRSDIVREYQPDIVIDQMVERNILNLKQGL